jgi:hypothetical protein
MMIRFAVILALAGLLVTSLSPPARADLSSKLGALTGENAKGYLGPLPKALSSTINSAIFHSGNVPKSGFAVNLGLHVMGVSFKDADRTFTPVDPAGFSSVTPTPVSTVIGGTLSVPVAGQGGTVLNYPGGLDVSQFTIAAPELSIGSVAGTRAVLRWFSADVGSSDYGKIELFGIGGQHSLSRYFKSLPADVALGLMYQTFKIGNGLLDTKALHVDVTASRRFGSRFLLEPYVSVGYDTFDMDVSYKSTTTPGDNISIGMNKQSNAHLAAGAQLHIVFLNLSAELVSAANTGAAIGLSFGY